MSRSFFRAIVNGEIEAVRDLLDENPAYAHARVGPAETVESDLEPHAGGLGLHVAARVGNAQIERLLVRAGADPSGRNAENRTALHVALEYNNTTRDTLIELGCPIDICVAAALSKLPRLEELLAADPQRVHDSTTGLSPLGWAAYFGAEDSVEALLRHGAHPAEALLCAAQVGRVPIGRQLLAAGADGGAVLPGWDGCALHAAATMRHTPDSRPFVELLLDHGVDVNVRAADGSTALGIARRLAKRQAAAGSEDPKPFEELAHLLQQRGGTE